jgi:predicted Zn-dependent protease
VPVPFDFDYAGLVGAPYAVPPEQVKLASVRVRRYRGFCRHNDALAVEAARFLSLRDELLAVVRAQALLEADDREEALRYLAAFFERVASPAAVADRLTRTCLQG